LPNAIKLEFHMLNGSEWKANAEKDMLEVITNDAVSNILSA